jgi:cytochrome c556
MMVSLVRAGAAALVIAMVASAAAATDDPIATRKALMDANGASAKVGGLMLKGDVPFDANVAMAALANFRSVGYAFGDYFPESSKTGKTEASPKIWEDMAGFQAAVAKFRTDAEAGLQSKPATLDAFKAAFGPVAGNCKSCHEKYRVDTD